MGHFDPKLQFSGIRKLMETEGNTTWEMHGSKSNLVLVRARVL